MSDTYRSDRGCAVRRKMRPYGHVGVLGPRDPRHYPGFIGQRPFGFWPSESLAERVAIRRAPKKAARQAARLEIRVEVSTIVEG